ncbi:lipid IV(A) 4-amino-4-deoxy-L-arabinosyltransferase [Celerinatantimonas yamalensis]|uniref:Lipid IV(A) 4-amino-4-deoxy-L-arabinosyltransferase n=1 Tax=Celerinatantimonas yamalensis TaxID=559956 RepID=A0ABW9GBZ1_9GAMM
MRRIENKWVLLIGFIALYLLPLGMHPFWMPDETRYAEISREMISGSSWIVPHFMGMHYFEKPVLGYWMNNLGQLIFGHTNFAARIAPALSIGLTALILYLFVVKALKNEGKAFYSTLVYLTCPLVFGVGTYNTLDSQLTLWMSAAFASFYYAMSSQTRRQLLGRYALFGLFCGAAFMTKGFVGLAMLVIAIIPFMTMIRRLPQVLIYGWIAMLAAILISLPWAIAVAIHAPDYWNFFFWNENIRRFAANNAQHIHPFWFYIPLLLPATMPWCFLAPSAIKKSLGDPTHRSFFLYQACCFVLPLILLSIAKGKLLTYILPLFMPLAILIGCGLYELIKSNSRVLRVTAWINVGLGILLGVALLVAQSGWVGKGTLYHSAETSGFVLGLAIFIWWAVVPLIGLKRGKNIAHYLAAVPLALFFCIPFALPSKVVNSKLPQVFYTQYLTMIKPNAWVVTNSVSLIGDIGWQLDRSDIDLLNSYGELHYGVKHSAKKRYYTYAQFADALAIRRQHQQVVLAMHANANDELFSKLPAPTLKFNDGRFYLYIYQQHP